MRRAAVGLVLLAVLGLGVFSLTGIWAVKRFEAPGPLKEQTTVIVPPGSGLGEIARVLADKGAIESRRLFVAGVTVFGRDRPIKAGEYAIAANLSPRGVMELLQSGKTVIRKLTIAEGLSSPQVMAEIAAAEGLEGTTPAPPPEGTMLPETYHYSYGDSRSEMTARMTKAMDETLAMLWAHRQANLPIAAPEQALILASIVEKETGRAEERPHVAAVFLNRLRRGIPLASDPTVIYGMERFDGNLRREDIETPTPYNTYLRPGLPPLDLQFLGCEYPRPGHAHRSAVVDHGLGVILISLPVHGRGHYQILPSCFGHCVGVVLIPGRAYPIHPGPQIFLPRSGRHDGGEYVGGDVVFHALHFPGRARVAFVVDVVDAQNVGRMPPDDLAAADAHGHDGRIFPASLYLSHHLPFTVAFHPGVSHLQTCFVSP